MGVVAPYRSTPIFDETTLPAALRAEHSTKAGVWGVVRVLAGRLKVTYLDPPGERIATPDAPALLLPQQRHFATPLGAVRVRIDFYDRDPSAPADAAG